MRTVALGEVADIERKGVDPSSVPPDTMYLGLEHIERGGRIIGHETVAGAQLASTKFRFSTDHVLFGKLRPNLGKISRPNFDGVCSTDILPIRPGKELDRDYLAHYLIQPRMVAFASSRTSGANLPRLSPTVLAQFPIPLPPLAEQRRIAAILDQVDALRTKHRQVLTNLEALAQSIFCDMFGDISADTARIDQVCAVTKGAIRTGPFGSQLLHSEFTDDGIAVLGIDNVVSNNFQWTERRYISTEKYLELQRYTVFPGDVLITIMGTCGRCIVTPASLPTAITTKHICAISLDQDKVLPDFVRACFLWHPISRRFLRQHAKGAIMAGLNVGIIKATPIPVAALDSQESFTRRLQSVYALRETANQSSEKVDALLRSLRRDAFSGNFANAIAPAHDI